MSAAVKLVNKAVKVVKRTVAAVGNVLSSAVKGVGKVLSTVGKAVEGTVKQALKDPIGTIAQIAAVATGQVWLLPVISAGQTIAAGGSLGDALKAAAISYAAGKLGSFAGEYAGGLFEGTTSKLASSLAQGAVSGASSAALSGRDIMQGLTSGLASGAAGFVASEYVSPYLSKNLENIVGITGETNKFVTGLTTAATKGALAAELKGQDAAAGAVSAMTGYGMKYGQDYVADAAGNMYDAFGRQFNASNADSVLKLTDQNHINDYGATLAAKGLEENKDYVIDDEGRVWNAKPIMGWSNAQWKAVQVGYGQGDRQFNPALLGKDIDAFLDVPWNVNEGRATTNWNGFTQGDYDGSGFNDPTWGARTLERFKKEMAASGHVYGDDYIVNSTGVVLDKYGNILPDEAYGNFGTPSYGKGAAFILTQNEKAANNDPGLLYTEQERKDLSSQAEAAVKDYNQAVESFEDMKNETLDTYYDRLEEWNELGAPGKFEEFYKIGKEGYLEQREKELEAERLLEEQRQRELEELEAQRQRELEELEAQRQREIDELNAQRQRELEELEAQRQRELEEESRLEIERQMAELELQRQREIDELELQRQREIEELEEQQRLELEEQQRLELEEQQRLELERELADQEETTPEDPFRVEVPETELAAPEGGEIDFRTGITWNQNEDGEWIGFDEDGNVYGEGGEQIYSAPEELAGEVDPVSGITWYPGEDGSKIGIDEDGNYYNEDGSIFWQPDYSGEFEMEEGFTPDTEGATEFDPDQFEPVVEPGQTPNDIFGQIKDFLGGSFGQNLHKDLQRRLTQPPRDEIYGSGRSYSRTPKGMYQRAAQPLLGSGFDWGDIKAGEQPKFSDTRDEAFQAEKPEVGAPELFDPLKDTKWAPMSRIEGLGFAGKFINQEPISMSTFDQKSKPVQVQQVEQDTPMTTGWKTADELQAEKEQEQREQQFQPEAQDMFFDPTDVNLAQPWWQQPEFQQQQNTMPVYAAQGGLIDHNPQFYSEGGASVGMRHVKGEGDGTSDSVPAMLAADEYVLPADIVSSLGNGSSDAGANVLDQFVKVIREHKRNADPEELSEDSQGPLTYLAEAYERVGA